jgi:hypothetical protein
MYQVIIASFALLSTAKDATTRHALNAFPIICWFKHRTHLIVMIVLDLIARAAFRTIAA